MSQELNTNHLDLDAAHYALRHQLITQEQLEEAVRIARQLSASGLSTRVNQVLVDKKFLSQGQMNTILQALGKPLAEIDNYEILSAIGKGGMGTVYKVRHKTNGRLYAMKVLKQDLSKEKDYLDRFTREIDVAMTLDHPNIASARDVGMYKGLRYYTMDYFDGDLLDSLITKMGRLSEQESARIALQIAHALAYADSKRLIHRDIKPSNIMIATDGTVQLLDLGIAKYTDGNANLTMSGFIVGSPHFLSPEQARCEPKLDIRSDIYSLGATLYVMVTGRRPFDGKDSTEIVRKRLNEDPLPPKEVAPDISPRMSSVILKMMAREPRARYQTPDDVITALESLTRGSASAVPTRPRMQAPETDAQKLEEQEAGPVTRHPTERTTRRTRRLVRFKQQAQVKMLVTGGLALAAVLLIIFVIQGLSSVPKPGTEPPPVARRPAPPAVQPEPPPPVVPREPEKTPPPQPPVKPKDPEPTPKPPSPPPQPPKPEPPKPEPPRPASSSPTRIASGVHLTGRIAFSDFSRPNNADLYVMNFNDNSVTPLMTSIGNEIFPVWSPDRTRVAFEYNSDTSAAPNENHWEIFVANADGSNAKNVTGNNVRDAFPSWSPDSRRIVFESDEGGKREIYVMDADGKRKPTRLTHDASGRNLNRKPAWSPRGNKIAFLSGEIRKAEIYLMDPDGRNKTNLSKNAAADDGPASWSPREDKLAFASNRDGNYEIYVVYADGSGLKRLTHNSDADSLPVWSPDGNKIAFVSNRDGFDAIYVMDAADGRNIIRVTDNKGYPVAHPSWTR